MKRIRILHICQSALVCTRSVSCWDAQGLDCLLGSTSQQTTCTPQAILCKQHKIKREQRHALPRGMWDHTIQNIAEGCIPLTFTCELHLQLRSQQSYSTNKFTTHINRHFQTLPFKPLRIRFIIPGPESTTNWGASTSVNTSTSKLPCIA